MKTKRILSAVMAVMLAVSMTACGEKGNDKNESDKKKTSADVTTTITTPTASTTTTAPADENEPVSMTTTLPTDDTENTTTTPVKEEEKEPGKEVVLDVKPHSDGSFESASGIAAAEMVLEYYGVKDSFFDLYESLDIVGVNRRDVTPWEYCMGTPETMDALYYAPVIKNAINTYLQNKGISNLKAKDITGCTPEDIYKYVQNGKPIIVVANIYMLPEAEEGISWTLPNGEKFTWKVDTEFWVVSGVNNNEVTVISGTTGCVFEFSKQIFEESFIAYESQAILVE